MRFYKAVIMSTIIIFIFGAFIRLSNDKEPYFDFSDFLNYFETFPTDSIDKLRATFSDFVLLGDEFVTSLPTFSPPDSSSTIEVIWFYISQALGFIIDLLISFFKTCFLLIKLLIDILFFAISVLYWFLMFPIYVVEI